MPRKKMNKGGVIKETNLDELLLVWYSITGRQFNYSDLKDAIALFVSLKKFGFPPKEIEQVVLDYADGDLVKKIHTGFKVGDVVAFTTDSGTDVKATVIAIDGKRLVVEWFVLIGTNVRIIDSSEAILIPEGGEDA